MSLQASYEKYVLQFKKPAGTSRGVLTSKTSYFITVRNTQKDIAGVGECSLIPGLSPDDRPDIEEIIQESIDGFTTGEAPAIPEGFPALQFAWESALLDLENGGRHILFPSAFTKGEKAIGVNGLIWMSRPEEMLRQADEKIEAGFRCIKLKVGALPFEEELNILKKIREKYDEKPELRLDANGAFSLGDALEKLKRLSEYDIHSVEQPIRPGQVVALAGLCKNSPVPIALDEELIGRKAEDSLPLLQEIRPQYIILKPSLIGGFKAADTWIEAAEKLSIGWWATSALESNVGLNAIAQWVGAKEIHMPQGLGTGGLFVNNTPPTTYIQAGKLYFGDQATAS